MPYLISLKAVTTFSFFETDQKEPKPAVISSDQLLLVKFLSATAPRLHTKIPKIEQIALVKAGQPFELYTKETCMEFHKLLCELLKCFKAGLIGLSKSLGLSRDVLSKG
jgi:hypothetical protein